MRLDKMRLDKIWVFIVPQWGDLQRIQQPLVAVGKKKIGHIDKSRACIEIRFMQTYKQKEQNLQDLRHTLFAIQLG